MKKIIVTISLTVLIFILCGCGEVDKSKTHENIKKTDTANEDVIEDKNTSKEVTRSDIEKQWQGDNRIFYICEENSDSVTGDINITNENYVADFVFFNTAEEDKILTLYINNEQVEFEVNGSKEIAHTMKFKKGKNQFKIKTSNKIKNGTNSGMLVISNCGVTNSNNILQYISFNIINNEVSKVKPIINLPENKIKYEILGQSNEMFSYFNLSLDNYNKEMFKNIKNKINVKSNDTITVPIVIGSNTITNSGTISVIIDGIEVEKEQLKIDEKNTVVYIPLQCKISMPSGEYIMNILITGEYNEKPFLERSQDIILEVN